MFFIFKKIEKNTEKSETKTLSNVQYTETIVSKNIEMHTMHMCRHTKRKKKLYKTP